MPDTSKAVVTGTNERAATVLVLTGDWKDNVYRMPPHGGICKDQFVEIIVHGDGIRANWPETA